MIGILAHQTELTDDEIIAETQHLFVGSSGVWIISSTALALLSQFPELMSQARKEIASQSEIPTLDQFNPYGFVPFGGGEDRRTQHRCLGENLLSVFLKLFLSQTLRHHDWILVNAEEVKKAPSPHMSPRILMKLTKRN